MINKPLRPHLFKAYRDFFNENKLTSYILVDTTWKGINLPNECKEFIFPDKTVNLNISPTAVGSFLIDEDGFSFQARFNGNVRDLYIPFGSLVAYFSPDPNNHIVFPFQKEDFYEMEKTKENNALNDKKVDSSNLKQKKNTHLKFVE